MAASSVDWTVWLATQESQFAPAPTTAAKAMPIAVKGKASDPVGIAGEGEGADGGGGAASRLSGFSTVTLAALGGGPFVRFFVFNQGIFFVPFQGPVVRDLFVPHGRNYPIADASSASALR